MVTVAAAAIAGAAQLAIKRTLRVVVVVGEYLIIELRICMAIDFSTCLGRIINIGFLTLHMYFIVLGVKVYPTNKFELPHSGALINSRSLHGPLHGHHI